MLQTKISYIILFVYLLIINLFNITCNNTDEKIVLKIGMVEISEYEFKKNLDNYKRKYRNRHKMSVPNDSIRTWIDRFIDKIYILAEAYELNYYSNPEIENHVDVVASVMLTGNDKPFFNEVIKKHIIVTKQDLQTAYQKRKIIYTIKWLKFRDIEEMQHILGEKILLNSKEEFEQAVKRVEAYKNVRISEIPLVLPTVNLWDIQEKIETMRVGEISAPLHSEEGIYIIHLIRKTKRERKPLEELGAKEALIKILNKIKEKKEISMYHKRVIDAADICYHKEIIDLFIQRLSQTRNPEITINTSHFEMFLTKPIISYDKGGRRIDLSLKKFISWYNDLPIKTILSRKSEVYEYLKDYIIIENKYNEAIRLDLHQDNNFMLDRKNYKNKYIYHKFIENEIISNIIINEEELRKTYNQRKDAFTEGEFVVVTIYYFLSRRDAILSRYKLSQIDLDNFITTQEDTILSNLIKTDYKKIIPANSKIFKKTIIKSIFEMPNGKLSTPFNFVKDTIIVILKHDEIGTRTIPYEEVITTLKRNYINETVASKLNFEILPILRKKYNIYNNISYVKLYSNEAKK